MSGAAAAAGAGVGGGRLTIPADTPYERQLLAQCIRNTVARWGMARIAVGRREVLAIGVPTGSGLRCNGCGRDLAGLCCRGTGPHRCLACALASALPDGSATATIAPEWPGAPHAERSAHSAAHSRRADAARSSIAQRRQ